MKELSTDNLLTIAEIAEDSGLVEILTEYKNTKEKDAEKVGMTIFVKTLSGISRGSKSKVYSLIGELTGKEEKAIKNQPVKATFEDLKAIFQYGENASLLKDFFN